MIFSNKIIFMLDTARSVILNIAYFFAGGKDYTRYIREQNVGLCQILSTFKTCKPPISRILGKRILYSNDFLCNIPL